MIARNMVGLVALMVAIAACQPADDAPIAGLPTAAPTTPTITEAPAVSPGVVVTGTTVTVRGTANMSSDVFVLDGSYLMKTSECASNGVIPFVWIYDEFGGGRGQYVDAESHPKNLKGNFYITVASNPTCNWTVEFSPE